MAYDLLLKGGRLIDPSQELNTIKDISFFDGKVAKLGDDITPSDAKNVINCSGYIITPGLIDIHVHTFIGVSHYGIEPDLYCINKGVLTAVDAGSAGAYNFENFKNNVIDTCKTQLFAFLNISSQGLLTPEIGELQSLQDIDIPETIKTIKKYKNIIRGIKVRLAKKYVAKNLGIQPLHFARTISVETGLPIVVHPQSAWCDSIDIILKQMQKDDILTHCFHANECGILDFDGKVRDSVREAVDRGIIFDVGHGRGSFNFEIAEKALRQNFSPSTISTDLHAYNLSGPVYDLPTTISKFLTLGLPLDEVILKATAVPAKLLGSNNKIGTLKKGASGNAVVFDMKKGHFKFTDSHGRSRIGEKLLVPKIIIRKGSAFKYA